MPIQSRDLLMTDQKGREGKMRPGQVPVRYLVRLPLILILQAAVLFLSAGRIDMPRAWIYLGTTSIYTLVSAILICKFNPTLIVGRAESITRRDIKSWDKILMPTAVVMQYVVQLAVIGLDVGRFQWSNLGINYAILGFVLALIGAPLGVWAAISNPYYEAVVRIQRDRNHKVITTGPYRIVRHPGYVSAVLWSIATPLIIGSVFGLIPSGVIVMLLIVRTALEDRMLQNELEGYSEYARNVKYRLLPLIW